MTISDKDTLHAVRVIIYLNSYNSSQAHLLISPPDITGNIYSTIKHPRREKNIVKMNNAILECDTLLCYICGAALSVDRDPILANGRHVPKGLSWRIRCSAEDFSKIVFRNHEVWGNFVRTSKFRYTCRLTPK
jgi:hypothetical protein